jgi:hypothetical protein
LHPSYKDPTETLPEPAPKPCSSTKCTSCSKCEALNQWITRYKAIVDDLILRSNIHSCTTNRNKDGSENKARAFKGCLDNIWGRCSARFPRNLFNQTEVDFDTGSLNMKKKEAWINTLTYVVTYLLRCNTDVTSLRSGTAIKGVLLYVTNYVTKSALKTHVVFDTIRSVFQKNSEMIGGTESRQAKARQLTTKIVNALSAKMEMGSPMICLYLLCHPDHYKSHEFPPFYWQSFVTHVRNAWKPMQSTSPQADHKESPEKLVIFKQKNQVVGLSPVADYVFRSPDLEDVCLYDWVSRTERVKIRGRTNATVVDESTSETDQETRHTMPAKKTSLLTFLPDHPFASSHATRWLPPQKARVPAFIGPTLPKRDQGDREYYCTTMLTLFKPWRSGLHLKDDAGTWSDAFDNCQFSQTHQQIMSNMNIRYECLDAQDDFHAQMKKGLVATSSWATDEANIWQDMDQTIMDDSFDSHYSTNPVEEMFVATTLGKVQNNQNNLMTSIRTTLIDAGWTCHNSNLLPQQQTSTNEQVSITHRPPSQWNAAVISKRAEILAARAYNMLSTQHGWTSNTPSKFTPNEVKIVNKSHLTKKFTSTQWQDVIDRVALKFELNKEQERAYRIVANHCCSETPDQLTMNLAGMAGTGKTCVIKAITEFFKQKKESHRLVVVAPTGNAASLLGGSTYHYMFGISQDHASSAIQMAQVKTRLQGVDYVFMDEVSMLCCRDMYLISARLAQIMNNPESPFGGINMIFAGDFAQLPPAIGGENASLYSHTVGINTKTTHSQEAAMGKALWHQITTVVILHQNMRQRHESAEDTKFRTALSNMRYKACTQADIAFLNTLVSSKLKGRSHITQQEFRNVSIITALNCQKDEINRLGSLRFAAESKQALNHFVSVDSIPSDESGSIEQRNRANRNRRRVIKHMKIPEKIQNALWSQSACANTKRIPPKLSICIGMPIMIRNNSATELCITKGQEAEVYSWQSSAGPNNTNILDTLFVKLIDPPITVQLEGLPSNVVPLIRTTVSTNCRLPDDSNLTVSRNQIEALPNFAMTDYASQGKTRQYNVVDLGQTRTHHGYYTALSRGSTASGTLILSGLHSKHITGGASGALRQEFRELELLDCITTMRFEGRLPAEMALANRRNTLIEMFRKYKGYDFMPNTMPDAIKWSKKDPYLDWKHSEIEWAIIKAAEQKANNSLKRKALEHEDSPAPKRVPPISVALSIGLASKKCKPRKKDQLIPPRAPLTTWEPVGTIWQNNSCAYDAVITILFNIW